MTSRSRPSLDSTSSITDSSLSTRATSLLSQIISHRRSNAMGDERTPRKQKKSDKFYHFLTRSRSRSRTKQEDLDPHEPGTKPSRISQSRPISSTTTATNTTITPQTPKPKKQPQSAIPVPVPVPSVPRSSTPKGARKKLHNLFRKSSLGSRPSSPEPELRPSSPPRPRRYAVHDTDETLKLWTARIPSRPTSPSPLPKSNPNDHELSNSTSTNASSSSKVEMRPSKTQLGNGLRVSHPRPKAGTTSSHIPLSTISRSPSDSSQPPDQPKQVPHRRDTTSPTSSPRPRASSFSKETTTTSTIPVRSRHRKESMDSAYRYKPMAMLDEEKPSGEPSNHAGKTNGHPAKPRHKPTLREIKHGSFDFERPGWSASVVRSPSSGSGSTALSNSYSRESFQNATSRIGSLQKNMSKAHTPPHSEPGHSDPSPKVHTRSASAKEQAEPSSLGRKTGKRILGSGIARLVGISHGPFSFEPPVPSPTTSNPSVNTKENGEREREKVAREAKEKDEARQREKERKRAARRTAIVGEPDPPQKDANVGFRSGTKGRSLDLGLGLSWAPTKMREDALLPSSVVFGKSLSASARNGLVRKVDTMEIEVDRSKIGKEVAEAFRKALDEEGYIAFKKYVHRFDAHDIPFDGPTGILARAERLLDRSSNLTEDGKRRLLDRLVRIILQNT